MRRFRLSTLLLLVVIIALGLGLVVQQRQADRREAALRTQIAEKDRELAEMKVVVGLNQKFSALGR